MFGALSNFDVFNDTGQPTHGFEIELDGLTSKDVFSTFGAPYQFRYGNPVMVDFAGGVYVRYQSPYDPAKGFLQATPMAPAKITPTLGHQCWTGGSAGYLTSGCEHFGIATARNPTAIHYRWLIEDPVHPGNLKPFGTDVSLPAPIWTVSPPPAPAAPPVVKAVVPAPPPGPAEPQCGTAQWVKIFVTEEPDHVAIHELVTDDPHVPQEAAEVEIEWTILQSCPGQPSELDNEQPLGANAQSVLRRYEFYKYIGSYDPENHEALDGDNPVQDVTIGDYIGAQNVAIHVVPGTQVFGATVTTSGFVYSRVTKTYFGTVTLKNTTGAAIAGPVQVVFANLPAGVTLVNPAGSFQGSPYLVFPTLATQAASLGPNQTATVTAQFTAGAPITFTPNIFSGSIQ